ncbi:hypothetical protein HYPSUDRAFT_912694 [Hypholoma sublateritium FD-334 SS-4]|uniref:Uncharacterized protein n=1 Tax=Hypholoma sublateritium (strain FD-334 SS-4) TaxID=945553 RepID=A0A0D2KW93_HYPSF|nr:hypothetical protein HYPSUDRAFT_912694 [Hypholoma sublateritium FD-334 SS-4]
MLCTSDIFWHCVHLWYSPRGQRQCFEVVYRSIRIRPVPSLRACWPAWARHASRSSSATNSHGGFPMPSSNHPQASVWTLQTLLGLCTPMLRKVSLPKCSLLSRYETLARLAQPSLVLLNLYGYASIPCCSLSPLVCTLHHLI